MRLTRYALPFVALAAGIASPVAANAQVLPHAPIVDHLPNGLTVVTLPFDAPGIAAYYTLVRTGARDEIERGHSGFAHLFEHMMFRGTERYSATEYEHQMQSLGADNNAYTTEDFTLYTVTLPARSLPSLVPIEADRFQHLSYAEQVFQTETRAVLGEYNKNAANPLQQMWESLSEITFTRHTYGHTTIGYLRDVEAMPHEYRYSQNFFRRFYTPDNCTVIVAGDVQHDAVLQLVRQSYAAWRGHRAQPRIPVEPDQTAARTRVLAWAGTTPPRLLVGYRIPGFDVNSNDTAALEVVHALAFSDSSDLYQRLVVREQKLLSLESWHGDFHRDPQLFVVEAKLAEGTPFEQIEQAVNDELARIGRGEYSRDRIEAVISHLRYELPMEMQTPSDAANSLARFMALTGDVDTLERWGERLHAVTPDDVARVARTYLLATRSDTIRLTDIAHAPPGAIRIGPAPRGVASSASPAPSGAPSGAPASSNSAPALPAGSSASPAPARGRNRARGNGGH
jgi:zinc protease